MNIKLYAVAALSLLAMAAPQNGIGCGPDEDPHDYFTSFFSRAAGAEKFDKPFYYTSILRYYDDWEEDSSSRDNMIEEWRQYTGAGTTDAAIRVVYKSTEQDVAKLASGSMPAPYARNEFAAALARPKFKPAADYLLFAKRSGVIGINGGWDVPNRDSATLNRFILRATDQFTSAPDTFLKARYAYQRCKLAFYNHRYRDCINWYDAYFDRHTSNASAGPALSYKAGSLLRLGRGKDAAYLFSKAFTSTERNRKAIYQSFRDATNGCDPKLETAYAAAAANNKEKAAIIGMFALWGMDYSLPSLEKVYELDPSSQLLPLLVNREVNKLEEQYFTPLLASENGGKPLYYTFTDSSTTDLPKGRQQLNRTTAFLQKLASDKNLAPKGFYAVSAAYLAFMKRDMPEASSLLAIARQAHPAGRTADQLQMIDLLVKLGAAKALDGSTAAAFLPSLKWLEGKAEENEEYRIFLRNFFSELVAAQYTRQGDAAHTALAYGVADLRFLDKRSPGDYLSENDAFYSSSSLDHLRNEMSSQELAQLYRLETSTAPDAWDNYLISHSRFKVDDVVDVLGTSYLREGKYPQAVEWLRKAGKSYALRDEIWNYKTEKEDTVNVDPFYDYLNDWQRYTKKLPKPYTKLQFAEKLLDFSQRVDTVGNAAARSKLYYTWASALYNMSYYGNAWQAATWNRSGADWNSGGYKLDWQKEYYGVYKARALYQQAYDAATDREFKAACLFMVLKCAQRQLVWPSYDNYADYTEREKADSIFQQKFRRNALFPKFVKEFGDTRFYSYVYNRCSYLRDFAARR